MIVMERINSQRSLSHEKMITFVDRGGGRTPHETFRVHHGLATSSFNIKEIIDRVLVHWHNISSICSQDSAPPSLDVFPIRLLG